MYGVFPTQEGMSLAHHDEGWAWQCLIRITLGMEGMGEEAWVRKR
jgi:hypothetical protein